MSRRDLDRLYAQAERRLARLTGRTARELTSVYKSVREEINDELSKVYRKYAVGGSLTRAEMTKYNRLDKLEKRLNTILGRSVSSTRQRVNHLSKTSYQEAFYSKSWVIEQNQQVSLSWGDISENTIKEAIDNDLSKIAFERLRSRGRERIRRTIASGLTRGASYESMAREMEGAINGTRNDALRIARTEAGRAQVKGSQKCFEKAEELGVEGKEIWVANLDSRTRDSHAELDGTPKNTDRGGWRIPGTNTYTEGPRQSGLPEEDINCRCFVRYEIEGLKPRARRTKDGTIPYKSYSRWKKEKEYSVA